MRVNLFLFLIVFPQISNSQNQLVGDFEVLSEKDGLPTRVITCLLPDKSGYIWLGTTEGLIRYDGYTFTSIRSSPNKSSISNNIIGALVCDTTGVLWIGQYNGIVTRYDPLHGTFTSFKVYEQSRGEPIIGLYFDSKGNLWVSVDRVGLFKFQPSSNNFVYKGCPPMTSHDLTLSENRYKSIVGIYEDSFNNFWLTTVSGLTYYDRNEEKFTKVINGLALGQIKTDSISNLWITSWGGGLVHYDVKSKKHTSYLWETKSNITSQLLWKSKNELWVTTFKGFCIFNTNTKMFSFFPTPPTSSENSPGLSTGHLINGSNCIWLTSEKGLVKVNQNDKKFQFKELWNPNNANTYSYYTSFVFIDTTDQTTYIGTMISDGLHIIKNNKEIIVKLDDNEFPGTGREVIDFCKDRNGNIWILTANYIYLYDRSIQQFVAVPQPIVGDSVSPLFNNILESSDGIIWIASYKKGLFSFDPKEKTYKQYVANETGNSICSNETWDIIEDKKKRIWIATLRSGISVFDPALNYFKNFNTENSPLTSNSVVDLEKTKNGDIWVASSISGLTQCKIDSGFTFKNWTIDDGLPSNSITSLGVDSNENIWGYTTGNILFGAQIANNKLTVRTFDYSDGLDRSLAGLGNDGTGNFYLCATGGYYSFNPQEVLKPLSSVPDLVLTSLLVNNERVFPRKDSAQSDFLALDHHQNVISFEFAALNYTHPAKNLYSYILEGIDDTWSPASMERSVKYSALQPGDYTFRVRLAGSSFAQNPEYSIRISVAKPFWKTWWFILSNVFLVVGVLTSAHRLRLKQVRKQQIQKIEFQQKIAEAEMHALRLQMNPHFIFNSLNSINRFILKSDVEQATHYLTKFSKLMRLILDNSKNKIVSLNDELMTIKLYIDLESIRFNGKFNYSINLDDKINPELIAIPPMLIQPFIENAIWHGLLHKNSVGNIQIFFQKENDLLVCTVQDDGIGRKMAQQLRSKTAVIEKSYGMKIAKDRLSYENQNGNQSSVDVFDLVSNDGISLGTKVVIKIKIVEA